MIFLLQWATEVADQDTEAEASASIDSLLFFAERIETIKTAYTDGERVAVSEAATSKPEKAPVERIFSFDRITRDGRWLR